MVLRGDAELLESVGLRRRAPAPAAAALATFDRLDQQRHRRREVPLQLPGELAGHQELERRRVPPQRLGGVLEAAQRAALPAQTCGRLGRVLLRGGPDGVLLDRGRDEGLDRGLDRG